MLFGQGTLLNFLGLWQQMTYLNYLHSFTSHSFSVLLSLSSTFFHLFSISQIPLWKRVTNVFWGISRNVQLSRVTKEKKTHNLCLDKCDLNTEPAAPPSSNSGSSFSKCVMPLSSCLELPHCLTFTLSNEVCVQLCLFSLDIIGL